MISWIFVNARKEHLVPNIKAAIKWTRASEKRRKRNLSSKTKLKTLVKKAGVDNADPVAVKTASSALDKAAARGIIHKNKAARQKSRMAEKDGEESVVVDQSGGHCRSLLYNGGGRHRGRLRRIWDRGRKGHRAAALSISIGQRFSTAAGL